MLGLALVLPGLAWAGAAPEPIEVAGIPLEFILFALTLLGVALFHSRTLQVALTGVTVITLYKIVFTGFKEGAGLAGFVAHLGHDWVVIFNLLGLLLGFALLARHFEDSEIPKVLPRYLPTSWQGAFVLLVLVFVLSSFLDNIAAALIGGAMAHTLFNKKVHIGYIAAHRRGLERRRFGERRRRHHHDHDVDPRRAAERGLPRLRRSRPGAGGLRHPGLDPAEPALADPEGCVARRADRLGAGGRSSPSSSSSAISTNVFINVQYTEHADSFPFIGVAVCLAILVTALIRKPEWSLLPGAFKGACFLLSLVLAATMMPVEKLPAAAWQTAFGLGFLSAVFDNIPLTALALAQGGYDWGMLAYAVGFGGSMIWFGSSAGVAISSMYPEARSVGSWLKNGWHVTVAYVAGFFLLLFTLGWQPHS